MLKVVKTELLTRFKWDCCLNWRPKHKNTQKTVFSNKIRRDAGYSRIVICYIAENVNESVPRS